MTTSRPARSRVGVVDASSPTKQRIADSRRTAHRVRNTDREAMPNVAVTSRASRRAPSRPGSPTPTRPVWIVDRPERRHTAYTNTWALGRSPPGKTKSFAGGDASSRHPHGQVPGRRGLNGKAKAQLVGWNGVPIKGSVDVAISRKPVQATVDPETGEVVREGQ